MKYYCGIGSRQTPSEILSYMTEVARRLRTICYILRSGHAAGADIAFEAGTELSLDRQIFLPKDRPSEAAMQIAASIHPAWEACNDYARCCHGRNVYQVLGVDLATPVEFVACWTPDAAEVGGTRTAIVLAKQRNIPVYNFADDAQLRSFHENLKKLEHDDLQERIANIPF